MQFDQKITKLKKQVEHYSREELIWFNGYLSGLLEQNQIQSSNQETLIDTTEIKPIILYGSETGNSKKLAFEFLKLCKLNKIQARSFDLATYKVEDLCKENFIVLICSTQGEGEPPLSAQSFFEKLSKVTLDLNQVKYCVLAIGDSSYPFYCKAGEQLDGLLKKQGSTPVIALQKLDVDYKDHTKVWFDTVLEALRNNAINSPIISTSTVLQTNSKVVYQAIVNHKVLLNDRESNKKTYHLELCCDQYIDYQPGDAIGVYPVNDKTSMLKIAQILGAKSRFEELKDLCITGLTKTVITQLSVCLKIEISQNRIDLLDLLERYNLQDSIDFDVVKDLLQPISPRLYSVSSSPLGHDNQVHLTVALDQFEIEKEKKTGLCSNYLSSFEIGQQISFYVHNNSEFYLPEQDKDIIMIGPGTGIAPFRAFLEHRDASGSQARNWLFFGEQYFVCDFYYQTEIQQWLESGVLTRLDTAFSRDQKHKVYVQHRLKHNQEELWAWIQAGAIIYVCGQKSPMSEDIDATLIEIIMNNQKSSLEVAKAYLEQMFLNGQYKKDVY